MNNKMNNKMNNNTRKVWMNGKIVDETEAKISVYDSALMYGDMVFEMTRSFDNKQFKLIEHIDRLYDGLKILRVPIEMTKKKWKNIVMKLLKQMSIYLMMTTSID